MNIGVVLSLSCTSRTNGGTPNLVTFIEKDVDAIIVSNLPHKAGHVPISCVDIIQQEIIKEGFAEEVAERAAKPQRGSSLSVYQSHYQTFNNWCLEKKINMESVNIQVVADYLLHMFKDLNRQVSTLCSHKTALSTVLGKFEGFTIGNHPVISNLIKNFWNQRISRQNKKPRLGSFESLILSYLIYT